MARKFFGNIFRRRKTIIPDRKTRVSDFTPIKPAQNITDFEYPPESSFYQEDAVELERD